MIFILDYENCHYAGMCGGEYLEPADNVEIFLSSVCSRVKSGDWNAIKQSGCKVSTYSLQQPGKQALDMAICTRVEEIINLLLDMSGPKILYLNSLKRFGRKSGTEKYRELKKMLV